MSTLSTTLDLRPAQIAPHPSNPRRDVGDLTELTASIKNRGVLQNLVVAPVPDGFKGKAEYVLVAGHRRLAAAKAAKLKTVPVTVREDLTDPADQLAAMLEENGHRTDLTAVEEATAVQGLLDLGLTQTKIAALTGMKKTRISERARLAKLPAEITEKVHTHQVTIADALAVAEFDGHEDLQASVTEALGTHNWRWKIEEARRTLTAAREHATRRKAYEDAGVTVLDQAPPQPGVDGEAGDAAEWYPLENMFDGVDGLEEPVAKHLGIEPENVDNWDQIEQWHQETCAGHAVYEYTPPYSSSAAHWEPICTIPSAHDRLLGDHSPAATSANAPKREEAEADRAREEQRAKFAEDLAVAATVRRAHVADVLAGATLVDVDQVARDVLVEQILDRADSAVKGYRPEDRIRSLAGFMSLPADSDADDVVAAVRTYTEKASLAQLVLLSQVVLGSLHEDVMMTDPAQAGWTWSRSSPFIEVLSGLLAYQWSDVERGLLPAADDDDEAVSA